jgi:hypothetical protein
MSSGARTDEFRIEFKATHCVACLNLNRYLPTLRDTIEYKVNMSQVKKKQQQ